MARDADRRTIKTAFRRLARKFHPDVNPDDPDAEEQFKKVLAAFRILSNPKTRRLYDEHGFEGLRGAADAQATRGRSSTSRKEQRAQSEAADIFADIFDGRSPFDTSHMTDFGGFNASLEHGSDLTATLTVDFLTAVRGGQANVRLPDRNVEVTIPEGAKDGDILRLPGQGARPPIDTGSAGDLTVELSVRAHRLLRRDGLDLFVDLPVTVGEAINGAEVRVPTPHGTFEVTVPSGVHSGTKLRLAGQGVRIGTQRGDFFAVVQIRTPDHIDEQARKAADALAECYSEDVRGDFEL